MNKIYLLVAAVIIIGGIYVVMSKSYQPATPVVSTPPQAQEQTPTSPETESPTLGETSTVREEASVEYTDNGFTPKSVTVKVGTTVTFINNSSKKMWIASAPHPQHTDLPGFDELEGAEEGGSYKYTFTKVGTWKFHNHLNPSDFGSVTVEE